MARPKKDKDKAKDDENEEIEKTLDRRELLKRKLKAINEACESNVIYVANERAAQFRPRLPTGIFGLDYATGGGIPIGTVVSIWGEKSGGKTTTCQRLVANAQKYCFNCYKWKWDCACGEQRLGVAVYEDLEGTYDDDWGTSIGVAHDELLLSHPESAEQAIDIMIEMVRSKAVDLLILDSIAMMTPTSEIEKSATQWDQGLQARLCNKMFRKLQVAINDVYNETQGKVRVTVVVLNQVRLQIGLMFGDPRTRIGGKGQEFAASVDIFMSSGKYNFEATDAGKKKEIAPDTVTLRYQIMKNKTGPAKIEGEYDMAVKDFEEIKDVTRDGKKVAEPTGRVFKRGEVIEDKLIIERAEDYGLIKKETPTSWTICGEQYTTKRDMIEAWRTDEKKWHSLRKLTLDAMLGK